MSPHTSRENNSVFVLTEEDFRSIQKNISFTDAWNERYHDETGSKF